MRSQLPYDAVRAAADRDHRLDLRHRRENAVGASVAGTFLNLIPVFGVAFVLLADESVSLFQLGGGAAVGFGVWLAASAGGRAFRAGTEGRSVT